MSSSTPSSSDAATCSFDLLYPTRKETPIISRTQASEAAAASSSSSDDSAEKKEKSYPDDRFDDSGSMTTAERSSALDGQRARISTSLDPVMRVAPTVPSFIPPNVPMSALSVPQTEISTLPNGVRVASQETYGQVCTVGVLANCGSRYEVEGVSTGVNHLLELLAFRSTAEFPTGGDIIERMDKMGGATFASSSREQMLYCIDILRPNAGAAVDILAETVLRPRIEDWEVEEVKQVVEFQSMDMVPEVSLGEGLQVAAYGKLGDGEEIQQLGKPHFCPLEALPNLSAQTVRDFRSSHLLIPSEMVICGAGISHPELVELATQYFSDIPSAAGGNPNEAPLGRTVESKYTGGEYRLQVKTVDEFTRVAMAFEVGGWHSSDLVPTCVLQTLLGGGSSFSAGGPGKGMYSRLYREVLNRYHWAESAEAFTSFHAESGLLGISGSSVPNKSGDVTRVIAEHLHKLATTHVSDEELDRARNMLKCNVLTQLESRLVLFEDIGRQILTYGRREDAETMCARIEGVTKEQIRDIAKRSLYGADDGSPRPLPTLSTVGDDISKVPTGEEVASWFR